MIDWNQGMAFPRLPSDLAAITWAKQLCAHVMQVTQKSPKAFRSMYVSRMQNLALDVAERLLRANEVYVHRSDGRALERRLELQHKASTSLKLLVYVAEISLQQGCLLMTHLPCPSESK